MANEKRILIVDDDPSYAGLVREWIVPKYHVDVVTSGKQALTYLSNTLVDLIILDYDMPELDGTQVFEMIKSEEATKDIPVVFLTGVETKEGLGRIVSLKPAGYILKAAGKKGVLGMIADILDRFN